MILVDENGKKWTAVKLSKRPKFSEHRGRTWDYATRIVNGKKFDFKRDFTWGSCWYFQYPYGTYQWFRMTADDFEQGKEFTIAND